MEIEVKLEGLRRDISYSLRQRHYTEAVKTLVDALDKASAELEGSDGAKMADKSGYSDFKHRFAMYGEDSSQVQRRPEHMEKKLQRLTT